VKFLAQLPHVAPLARADPEPLGVEVAFDQRLANLLRPAREHPPVQAARERANEEQLDPAGLRLARSRQVQTFRHVGIPVLMEGVQAEQACHLAGIQLRKAARIGTAQGMRHQQVGTRYLGRVQDIPELGRDIGCGTRQFDPVAPARAAAVVKDGRGELGDLVVDVQVVQADGAGSGQEHDGRPGARAVQ
jgi:hypothetical protein